MRSLFALALSALLATCAACGEHTPPKAPGPEQGSVEDLTSKTIALVRLGVDDEGVEVRAYCSGVWISPRRMLTAGHCVAQFELGDSVGYATHDDVLNGEVQKAPFDTTIRGARLVAVDEDHDVAVLEAEGPVPNHASAALASARAGDRVQTMGHPLGLWWSYSRGDVAALRALPGDETVYVQTTAPISQGNSGGGLFNERGEVVGIAHAYFPQGENLNLYVDSRYVKDLLKGIGA